MAVTLNVNAYPHEVASSIEVEEYTEWGWATVLESGTIGTSYSVTPTSDSNLFRYRWIVGTSPTQWAKAKVVKTLTAEQEAALKAAIIQKATRNLVLSPYGKWGSMEGFSMTARPDYEVQELLYGLRLQDWDIDLTTLVTTDDVIRVGFGQEPGDFPGAADGDVARAIDTAVSQVSAMLTGGFSFA